MQYEKENQSITAFITTLSNEQWAWASSLGPLSFKMK